MPKKKAPSKVVKPIVSVAASSAAGAPQLRAATGAPLPLPQHLATGLSQLLRAFDYAADAGTDVWQLAMEIADLRTAGFTTSDFRWLVFKGYLQHGHETTLYGDLQRTFRIGVGAMFLKTTSFVLTPTGAVLLRSPASTSATPLQTAILPTDTSVKGISSGANVVGRAGKVHSSTPLQGHHGIETIEPRILPHSEVPLTLPGRFPHDTKPVWENRKRELWVGKLLIKRFRVPADNQEAILAAFQEEGWPSWWDPLESTCRHASLSIL